MNKNFAKFIWFVLLGIVSKLVAPQVQGWLAQQLPFLGMKVLEYAVYGIIVWGIAMLMVLVYPKGKPTM